MKKRVLFTLIVVLVFIASLCLSSCDKPLTYEEELLIEINNYNQRSYYNEQFTPEHDKAIIIVHGLMDGSLYDPDTGDGMWILPDMSESTDIGQLLKGNLTVFSNLLAKVGDITSVDADGYPVNKMMPGNMKSSSKYDATNLHEDIYKLSKDRYGDSYDVIAWQYDWRTEINAITYNLNAFIEKCGYKNVIFIGHSMGCNIISHYLTLGETQRNKVELFVSYGGPLLGAIDSNVAMFESENYIETCLNMFTSIKLGDFSLAKAADGIASNYQIAGNEKFNEVEYLDEGQTFFSIDNEYKSYDEWVEYVKSLPWSKNSKGETKFYIDTFNDYYSKQFVDGVHISRLVNTEYIACVGVNTAVSFNINSKTGKINNVIATDMGDMMVTLYSATAGLVSDSSEDLPENVQIIEGFNHLSMVQTEQLEIAFDRFDRKNAK